MKVSILILVFFANYSFAYSIFSPLVNLLNEERLIVTSEDSSPIKVTETDKLKFRRNGVRFIDITNHQNWFWSTKEEKVKVPIYNYPTNISYSKQVEDLVEDINKDNLKSNLAEFSSFYSRYYKSDNGLKSSTWLFERLQSIIADNNNYGLNVTVEKFIHDWAQFSIIVKIEGHKTPEDIIVVGSHQDSANLLLPNILKAPGADDDGSGVVTNLEALRIILSQGIKFDNSLEFHFFSAEEGGLLGSLDIFRSYKSQNKKVVSMLQQDMTGFIQKTLDAGEEEHVGVISDNVSPELTEFVKLIIDSYLNIPWRETLCGYACSDHSSALQNSYPSSFIIESEFKYTNPFIHSTGDTLDRLSFDHIGEFVKLVLGFTYELGFHEFREIL
ncbi:hypothetical protein WICMUC_003721 [Wickerhamomyces mucosus]|uniref:Peptide hydrolase n=1 Tax=Wickerhamomyces mucosus TaxID=1378264 RepID=A0A9P8PJK4_9ASCO|nr:hypothetical protein WICMUC_003721 [Wickerhamomyces mucosus]